MLDKSFLQGAGRSDVLALAASHQLVMPAALFYELLTTSPEERRACFGKLPQTENPVVLVDHIGVLLAHEVAQVRPSGKPSGHRISLRFRFNDRLLAEDYVLPEEAQAAVTEQAQDVERDIEQLLVLAEQTPSFFPDLLTGPTPQQLIARARAERAISQLQQVHRLYSAFESVDPLRPHPVIRDRFSKWAHLRWLQVLMLFAVNVFVRYRGGIRSQLTPRVRLQLEHDVHDAQILALGVLEGAIATREKKLLKWWTLINPGGRVHGVAV